MDTVNPLCLPKKLISKHVPLPLESEYEIYRLSFIRPIVMTDLHITVIHKCKNISERNSEMKNTLHASTSRARITAGDFPDTGHTYPRHCCW